MHMWDLTYTISEDMLLYPGTPQPKLHDFATPAKDGYGMSEFTFWNHLGTHIDAPNHFHADGRSLDQFPLSAFVRRVLTIDGRDTSELTAAFLEPRMERYESGDGVLLLTGQYRFWGTPDYFRPFPVLSDDGADFLLHRNVGMILVDAPSVDPVSTESFPIHRRLLRSPLLIVENLAYQPDLPAVFHITALPLKIKNSNGSPARVIATP